MVGHHTVQLSAPAGLRTGLMHVSVLNRDSNSLEFILLPGSGSVNPTTGPASSGTRVTVLAPPGTPRGEFNVLVGSTLANGRRAVS